MRRRRWWIALGLATLVLLGLADAGRFLLVNDPQPADLIVSVGGEYAARPEKSRALLRAGMAPRLMLSLENIEVFGQSEEALARHWVQEQAPGLAIAFCANDADSTREEAIKDRRCLSPAIHSVLLVTSGFHTRRARSIFQHEWPGVRVYVVSATADTDDRVLPTWWRSRRDAKEVLMEWTKSVWWYGFERWLPVSSGA